MGAEAGNLPQELTSFVGRQRELSQVKRLLAGSRLLTLVGVGGVGKTRLALRVAAGVRRSFGAGVWLVELDQVLDEGLVGHAVARAMGLREQPGLRPVAVLSEYLANRRALLVLDNCEHLVGGVSKLVEELLRDTAEVRILATSREPLHVEGERVHPVASLTVPDPRRPGRGGQLGGYEAVALFTERAAAVVAGFELSQAHQDAVGEICSRLEGLPLAIELAAARLRVLTPEQIRDRLTDRALLTRGRRTAPARQQTLRACIEWSHDLCTRDEQLLWARLSVFVGDFDVEAAEGVCADDRLAGGDVRELIASLADKSILVAQAEQDGVASYRMLDSIRTYGRQRLVEIGEEPSLRRRHRDWHQQLATRFRAEWIGPDQRHWLRRLDRTLSDLQAAMEFSLSDPQEADAALVMVVDLQMYMVINGLHSRIRDWLNRALALSRSLSPVRVSALECAATLAIAVGDAPNATTSARQARRLAGQLGDARSDALATVAEAVLAIAGGDLAAGVSHYTEALAVFRTQGDVYSQVTTLAPLTITKVLLDDTTGAAACHEAMQAIGRPNGESLHCGFTAMALGIGLWKRGDLDAAATQMTLSLRLIGRVGEMMVTSWCLEVTAWVAAGREQPQRAAVLLGATAGLADSMGTRAAMWPELLTYHEQCMQQVRFSLGERAFEAAFDHGHDLPLKDVIAYALGQRTDWPQLAPESKIGSGPLSTLTRREHDVAVLLAQGLSNKAIAEQLVLSPRTVEGHVDNILRKLDCTSRAQAATLIIVSSADSESR
jgi:predicted ATPase/DNA-binding CsgD family transcriptional regulator